MSSDDANPDAESHDAGSPLDGVLGVVTGLLGLLVLGYGLLVVSVSVLGGAWIAAIGAALLCAVAVGSGAGRRRLGLSPGGGLRAAVGFVAVAILLAVAFVLVNGAAFEAGEVMES